MGRSPYLVEADLETVFCREVDRRDDMLTLKLNVQGRRGWPDRLVLRVGLVRFVELKTRGPLSKMQVHRHQQLHDLGFVVAVLRTREEIREYLATLAAA